ncbi:Negative transcriptional regulator-copper transport operon [Streptococcus sp. HSISB1]|nr:Negative transcriptional regulator-copper transport operon [Streptococcus sp. HSISB1]
MSISKAEWEIMRVVWTKEETTSSQILAILGEKMIGQLQPLRRS